VHPSAGFNYADIANVRLDELTAQQASDFCLYGYEQDPSLDPVEEECRNAVFEAETSAECEMLQANCLASNPEICNGQEQLGFLSTCTATVAEAEDCFSQASAWVHGLTCADVDNPNPPPGPTCLQTICPSLSGSGM
jgi:hypothetical protein